MSADVALATSEENDNGSAANNVYVAPGGELEDDCEEGEIVDEEDEDISVSAPSAAPTDAPNTRDAPDKSHDSNSSPSKKSEKRSTASSKSKPKESAKSSSSDRKDRYD